MPRVLLAAILVISAFAQAANAQQWPVDSLEGHRRVLVDLGNWPRPALPAIAPTNPDALYGLTADRIDAHVVDIDSVSIVLQTKRNERWTIPRTDVRAIEVVRGKDRSTARYLEAGFGGVLAGMLAAVAVDVATHHRDRDQTSPQLGFVIARGSIAGAAGGVLYRAARPSERWERIYEARTYGR